MMTIQLNGYTIEVT